MIMHESMAVLAVLLGVLACLFAANEHPLGKRVFKVVPLLVFAYFIPTVLSNTGLIPLESPLYDFIKQWLLPASLVLLTLSVDIPGILRLGPNVVILFLAATATIVVGGPLALLLGGGMIQPEMREQAWRGLAALAGSWIGGGANFVAIGESVGTNDSTMAMMVVVDVAVANVWMAVLLFFAGRDERMDRAMGADRSGIDALRAKMEALRQAATSAPNLGKLLVILFLAFGGALAARQYAAHLPDLGSIIRGFTWVVILVTTLGVGLSFTPLRKLEAAGASRVGSVFLYLLVATIGAKAKFSEVGKAPELLLIAVVWILVHIIVLLLLRRLLKAPIFYMAIASQANIGGAASAPIVASAFHPSLAPVGVLLGVAGYVLGTYAGLLCAGLLEMVARLY